MFSLVFAVRAARTHTNTHGNSLNSRHIAVVYGMYLIPLKCVKRQQLNPEIDTYDPIKVTQVSEVNNLINNTVLLLGVSEQQV